MFSSVSKSNLQTTNIDLTGPGVPYGEGPAYIAFKTGLDGTVTVSVEAFQRMRRSFPIGDNGQEQKIWVVKDFRAWTKVGLKSSKDIVEWFFANYARSAQ
jgi:hypothetical protein